MSILEDLIKMPGFLPVLSAIGGSLITGLFLYLTNITNKRSEERKYKRELVFKTAFDRSTEQLEIFNAQLIRLIKGNRLNLSGKIWQRSFYEHVIRDEKELKRIREYIKNNPLNWDTDDENLNKNT